jgi:CRP-like cAMP-binding protein
MDSQLQTELGHLASVLHKQKGAILFRRGDPGIGVFLIRKGKVSLQLDGDIALYPSRALGPGAIVGLPATISGEAYSLAAEVIEDAELGFVSRDDFLALMKKDTSLCLEAMDLLGKEIASIRSALASHGKKKAPSAFRP